MLPDARPPYASAMRVGAVAGVLCARCGAVLAPEDLTMQLVAKLAQLNRFGLATSSEADRIWWSGGGGNVLHTFRLADHRLHRHEVDTGA